MKDLLNLFFRLILVFCFTNAKTVYKYLEALEPFCKSNSSSILKQVNIVIKEINEYVLKNFQIENGIEIVSENPDFFSYAIETQDPEIEYLVKIIDKLLYIRAICEESLYVK